MEIGSSIEKILSEFGINLVVDSRGNLKKKLDERAFKHGGKSVQSRLSASIKSVVGYNSGSIKLSIQMNDYWKVVDSGRNEAPVSKEGQGKIKKWVQSRGVAEKIRLADLKNRKDKQVLNKTKRKKKTLKKMDFERASKAAAFLVSRSLKNKRLEPTNFFTEVIKDGRLNELKEKLSKVIKSDIIIELRNGINS